MIKLRSHRHRQKVRIKMVLIFRTHPISRDSKISGTIHNKHCRDLKFSKGSPVAWNPKITRIGAIIWSLWFIRNWRKALVQMWKSQTSKMLPFSNDLCYLLKRKRRNRLSNNNSHKLLRINLMVRQPHANNQIQINKTWWKNQRWWCNDLWRKYSKNHCNNIVKK